MTILRIGTPKVSQSERPGMSRLTGKCPICMEEFDIDSEPYHGTEILDKVCSHLSCILWEQIGPDDWKVEISFFKAGLEVIEL